VLRPDGAWSQRGENWERGVCRWWASMRANQRGLAPCPTPASSFHSRSDSARWALDPDADGPQEDSVGANAAIGASERAVGGGGAKDIRLGTNMAGTCSRRAACSGGSTSAPCRPGSGTPKMPLEVCAHTIPARSMAQLTWIGRLFDGGTRARPRYCYQRKGVDPPQRRGHTMFPAPIGEVMVSSGKIEPPTLRFSVLSSPRRPLPLDSTSPGIQQEVAIAMERWMAVEVGGRRVLLPFRPGVESSGCLPRIDGINVGEACHRRHGGESQHFTGDLACWHTGTPIPEDCRQCRDNRGGEGRPRPVGPAEGARLFCAIVLVVQLQLTIRLCPGLIRPGSMVNVSARVSSVDIPGPFNAPRRWIGTFGAMSLMIPALKMPWLVMR
jgi:hypothetical protein